MLLGYRMLTIQHSRYLSAKPNSLELICTLVIVLLYVFLFFCPGGRQGVSMLRFLTCGKQLTPLSE
jgi:hypothetical protein